MEREIKTYRKPYNREVKRSWWIARREYVMYMIRELTAVTNLWVGSELTWIAWLCATQGDAAQAQVVGLLGHSAVVVANIVALLGVIYHVVTWYKIFPLGIRLSRSTSPSETRLVPRFVWMLLLYGVTIVASIVILYGLTYRG